LCQEANRLAGQWFPQPAIYCHQLHVMRSPMLKSLASKDRAEMVNGEGGGDLRFLLVGVYQFTPHEASVE
jgi:hypothetical protein